MDTPSRPLPCLVIVAESDAAVRNALTFFLESQGYRVRAFDRAGLVLADPQLNDAACLVIDQTLNGGSGLDLLDQLKARGPAPPAILVANSLTGSLAGRAAGVGVTIVEKPFLDDQLLTAVEALTRSSP